jgi:xylan 1,4-beta-xylosidase
MGSPSQLTREQVKIIKTKNADQPISEATVTIGVSGKLEKQFKMRQNDLLLVKLVRQQ